MNYQNEPSVTIGDRLYVSTHENPQYRKVVSTTKHLFKVEGLAYNFSLKTLRQDIDGVAFVKIYKTKEECDEEQLRRFLTREIAKKATLNALQKVNTRELKTIAKILKIKSVRYGL